MYKFRDMSDQEITRRGNEAFNSSVIREALKEMESYDPAIYKWSETPPKDDKECEKCYEWRRYPPGQRHFGYAWFRVCDTRVCECEHHKDEIWIA